MVGGHDITAPAFTGQIVVEQERGGWWVLERALRYDDRAQRIAVLVPAGFITDFASIPRLFWNLAAPTDYEYSAASIVHDRLYETHECERRAADAIFFDAMAVHGTPWLKRIV